jgi:hypothetical protein
MSKAFGEIWESIFYYTKSADTWIFYQQYTPYDQDYIESHFSSKDPDGRRWTTSDLVNPGFRPNLQYDYKGYRSPRNGWKVSLEKMEELVWDTAPRNQKPFWSGSSKRRATREIS